MNKDEMCCCQSAGQGLGRSDIDAIARRVYKPVSDTVSKLICRLALLERRVDGLERAMGGSEGLYPQVFEAIGELVGEARALNAQTSALLGDAYRDTDVETPPDPEGEAESLYVEASDCCNCEVCRFSAGLTAGRGDCE